MSLIWIHAFFYAFMLGNFIYNPYFCGDNLFY